MDYDVVVVGAGLAGLTAAAYLSHNGQRVLLCEKSDKVGGLVNSFEFKGFTFDGGIRAIENSGIVFPMLRQLGIDLPMVNSPVSLGIGQSVIKLGTRESLDDYQRLLTELFPDDLEAISEIVALVRRVMGLMDVLYGIDNPLFMEIGQDKEYLFKTLLPWLVRYTFSIRKATKLNMPVNELLSRYTQNQTLIDMITQHFFQATPAFFALSYFGLYLDYNYPLGGTGRLADVMAEFITAHGGEIALNCGVENVLPGPRQVKTSDGRTIDYQKLIWAGDLKAFYRAIDLSTLTDPKLQLKVSRQREQVLALESGDSVLTLYLAIDRDKAWFDERCGAHMFYTPFKEGLHKLGEFPADKEAQIEWFKEYLRLTTYEISCPVLRDASLAPAGQTGLIVSTLMDYGRVQKVMAAGWYNEYKELCARQILAVLEQSLLPDLTEFVLEQTVSTPLTLERHSSSTGGAITGWAFTQDLGPVESRFKQIQHSIVTPFADIFQAGQWAFSPSGLPIAILTGKLAADAAKKAIKHDL